MRALITLLWAGLLLAGQASLDRTRNLLAKGALKEAAEMLRQIIAVDPRNADARMVLGTTLALEGIHSESTQQLMEAVRLRPGSGGS